MCRECASSEARLQAASEFLAQCRELDPLTTSLKEAFPLCHVLPGELAALVHQFERINHP
jgi:hypothetical protein